LVERHSLLVRLRRELVVQIARHPHQQPAGVARFWIVLPHAQKIS
jgi:hypothetical protein